MSPDTDQISLGGEVWAVVPKDRTLTDEAMVQITEGLRKEAPAKRFIVFGEPVDITPISLDAAWREAEAACKERGVFLKEVAAFNRKGRWQASAWEDAGDHPHTTGEGDSPAQALTVLAQRLRSPSTPNPEEA